MNRTRIWMVLAGLLVIFILAGCGPTVDDVPDTGVQPEGGAGIQPEAVLRAQEMLAENLGVNITEVQIVEVEQQEWPDACLGLAGEGEVCAQVVTPGYQVTLEVNGETFVIRTDEIGDIVRQAGEAAGQP